MRKMQFKRIGLTVLILALLTMLIVGTSVVSAIAKNTTDRSGASDAVSSREKENTIRKHLPFLIFLAAVLASALIFDFRTQRTFIFGDGASYYTFLPELFIHHKLGPFVKYPVGTAVLMAPFFWRPICLRCF